MRREAEERYGEYRTRRVILEMYDDVARQSGGLPYQTFPDPPPVDPRLAHPARDG